MIEKAEKFYHKKLYKQAEKICSDLIKSNPNSVIAHRIMACVLLETNRIHEGIFYLKTAISQAPNDVNNYMALGKFSVKLQEMPQAINAYNKAYAIDPKQCEALLRLGEIYQRQNDLPMAISYYAAYINDSPINRIKKEPNTKFINLIIILTVAFFFLASNTHFKILPILFLLRKY